MVSGRKIVAHRGPQAASGQGLGAEMARRSVLGLKMARCWPLTRRTAPDRYLVPFVGPRLGVALRRG